MNTELLAIRVRTGGDCHQVHTASGTQSISCTSRRLLKTCLSSVIRYRPPWFQNGHPRSLVDKVAPGHNEVVSSPALWDTWLTPAKDIPLAKSHIELWPNASLPNQVPVPWKGTGNEATASQCSIPTVPSRIPRTQQGIRISALTEAPEVCSSSDFYQHLTPLLRWASGIRVYKIHMQPEQKEARELTGLGPFSSLSR